MIDEQVMIRLKFWPHKTVKEDVLQLIEAYESLNKRLFIASMIGGCSDD